MVPRKTVISIFTFELTAIAIAVSAGLLSGDLLRHFGEGYFITWVSFMQLLALSFLSNKIFIIRAQKRTNRILHSEAFIWRIITFGFLFLAFDEILLIHEGIDKLIHIVFRMQETGLTDRIDDVLILIYGIIGVSVLYFYRNELKKYKDLIHFLVYAFLVFFAMVILDIITNRDDILSNIFTKADLILNLKIWLSVLEDSLKIFSEGIFILGFFAAYRKSLGDLKE